MKQYLFFLVALLVYGVPRAESTITDARLGFTITLPEHWIMDSSDGTHPVFLDTTKTNAAIIAVERYDFSTDTIYEQADEWTRANFIAYSFIVDADPFSSMLFYDTVTTRQSGVPWSTEAYSVFYDAESPSADIAEYIRYTAAGTLGYEIYAIGPLEDMNEHVGVYAAIIEGVRILTSAEAVRPSVSFRNTLRVSASASRNARYDLLGRSITPLHLHHASRIVTGHGIRSLLFR